MGGTGEGLGMGEARVFLLPSLPPSGRPVWQRVCLFQSLLGDTGSKA